MHRLAAGSSSGRSQALPTGEVAQGQKLAAIERVLQGIEGAQVVRREVFTNHDGIMPDLKYLFEIVPTVTVKSVAELNDLAQRVRDRISAQVPSISPVVLGIWDGAMFRVPELYCWDTFGQERRSLEGITEDRFALDYGYSGVNGTKLITLKINIIIRVHPNSTFASQDQSGEFTARELKLVGIDWPRKKYAMSAMQRKDPESQY